MYKHGTFKWFEKPQLESLINAEVKQVADILFEQGVTIETGGLWNIKAPDPVMFTNKQFTLSTKLHELSSQNPNIILKAGFIGFIKQRLSIVYEE